MANYSDSTHKGITIRQMRDGQEPEFLLLRGNDVRLELTKKDLESLSFHLDTYLENMARQEDEDNCQHQCSSNCRREGCVCIDSGHEHA